MSHSVTCYASRNKPKSRLLSEAFAQGCNGTVVIGPQGLAPGLAAFYGVQSDTLRAFNAARARGGFYYIDNAYAGTGFRITRDRLQHSGIGEGDRERFRRLGVPIKPWRKSGSHVLVCPPGDYFMSMTGQPWTADEWLARTLDTLTASTDRPIRVRHKPAVKRGFAPLAADLADCWALVTHMSATAIEAVLSGVPAFVSRHSAAAPVSATDLTTIETPRADGDREAWAAVLAANQWSIDEIRNGIAWERLNGAH